MGVGTTGILGGAFDPPHNGHVAVARAAIGHFGLARLLVRVVAQPGHKDVVASAADRLALSAIAFADVPGAEVSLDPFGRTVESLESLQLDDPVFVVGADEFASFLGWKSPDRVLELARLGVATRPGYPRETLDGVLSKLARPERVELFAIEPHAVSSSEIRDRVRRGQPCTGLVPAGVAAEIELRGLYRSSPRATLTGSGGHRERTQAD
jgi:nicotinate-nucleotide adenylyltransferase